MVAAHNQEGNRQEDNRQEENCQEQNCQEEEDGHSRLLRRVGAASRPIRLAGKLKWSLACRLFA
jgi:hypothetical protein